MEGVTTIVGHGAIPFSGLDARRAGQLRGVFRGGASASWDDVTPIVASATMRSLAAQAMVRYQAAIDQAYQACDSQSGFFQATFNWVTGNTSTQSICNAADQMQTNYDNYVQYVRDPLTTDDQLAEIIGFVNREANIADLVDLARATNALSVTGNALLTAPGTAIGIVAKGVNTVAGSILGNIPWWGWAAGAVFLAVQLGWKPLDYKPLRAR